VTDDQPTTTRPDGPSTTADVGLSTILVEARVIAETLRPEGTTLAQLQQSVADLQRSVDELAARPDTSDQQRKRDRIRVDLAVALAAMSFARDVIADGIFPAEHPPPPNVTIVVRVQQDGAPPFGPLPGE
jgi:hypothetical protein